MRPFVSFLLSSFIIYREVVLCFHETSPLEQSSLLSTRLLLLPSTTSVLRCLRNARRGKDIGERRKFESGNAPDIVRDIHQLEWVIARPSTFLTLQRAQHVNVCQEAGEWCERQIQVHILQNEIAFCFSLSYLISSVRAVWGEGDALRDFLFLISARRPSGLVSKLHTC